MDAVSATIVDGGLGIFVKNTEVNRKNISPLFQE
jgi:hypothetical protein